MQNAIEFITKKNGKIIEIPEEYINQISGEFRVILLLDEKPKKANRKRKFKALSVDTKNFKFNRDEIYD